MMNKEEKRISDRDPILPKWLHWGPYVSERAWGTVREDYSPDGKAWESFSFDEAMKRTYRWGEDAIAGLCDRYQVLVFAPAFWNGKDPFLKERLFGLASFQGNHGEDVKEVYFHKTNVPSHSYMHYVYRYPQNKFPYEQLKEENQKRGVEDPEYELIDTGIFENNEFFDIHIEYAKEDAEDICIKIEAFNRASHSASLHIIPQLWFRNQWSWEEKSSEKPKIYIEEHSEALCIVSDDRALTSPKKLLFDYHLNLRYLYAPKSGVALFTDNETNHKEQTKRLSSHLKDAFHRKIIYQEEVTKPDVGTKNCIHYFFEDIPAGNSVCLYLRLTDKPLKNPLKDVEKIIKKRKDEAEIFYEELDKNRLSPFLRDLRKKALSALLWSKQIYLYDVDTWLKGDNEKEPPSEMRKKIRNEHWKHLNSMRIMNMPDKWEYPWFAAWDQAFHSITLALVDLPLAKEHLSLLLHDQFQHPNGQIPACEWEFSDMNPPVQAWAVLKIYDLEKKKTKKGDREFVEKCFHKLLMNFSWWVNKVDPSGNNVFEGGFLGLDNIAIFDRSERFEGGVKFQQSDGTGWMAMFCLNLMRMALILAEENSAYEALAVKFFEHYVYIAHAMRIRGDQDYGLWSEKDGFFYDILTQPDGTYTRCELRSLVGIIPLYAIEILEEKEIEKFPYFKNDVDWFLKNRTDLVETCVIKIEGKYVLTPMSKDQLARVLGYVWDPNEFRSEYGLRSLSKYHQNHPFKFQDKQVFYEPGESVEKIKGGNSNWRGPIWFPTNYLLIEALEKLGKAFGKDLMIKVGEEDPVTCEQMALSFVKRLLALFEKENQDEMCFYEYFNPETGKGLGARCQTGWTALIANLIDDWSEYL